MDAGDRTIKRLKFVLGAEGWKAFMVELVAARGRGRKGVVVEKWLAVARTKKAEKLAEQLKRTEAKAKADAEIEKQRREIADPADTPEGEA